LAPRNITLSYGIGALSMLTERVNWYCIRGGGLKSQSKTRFQKLKENTAQIISLSFADVTLRYV
jgi:hypothetical protein